MKKYVLISKTEGDLEAYIIQDFGTYQEAHDFISENYPTLSYDEPNKRWIDRGFFVMITKRKRK